MFRKWLIPLAVTVLLVGVLAPAGAGAQPDDETIRQDRQVRTASERATDKIQPALLETIETAPSSKDLRFVARIVAGTDLSDYSDAWFARPFIDPLGSTVASGMATGAELIKMAADPGVIAIQRPESLTEVPTVPDPDVAGAINAAVTPTINTDADASPGPAPEGWYHTGSAVHGSQEAWAKGYTGAGVRYMSNDSGADYCHPDLHGTWAYIDDASSPYYGLPQMFDSISSFFTAFDFFLGTSNIASGTTDYADTSATAAGDFTYQPIGAAAAHNYTVPATSLSGDYHYGSHPDKALAAVADVLSGAFGAADAVAGERAAVLVVDENTAGVYDTVYVDLDYDYDFTDEVPARLTKDMTHQEAACLDYDADGLNDVSGGLVYFIADGVNGVPTQDWLWGIDPAYFGNGDLVAFHVQDFTEGGGTHGQGTTSVAVGQGVVAGSVTWGPGGSPIAGFQGLVLGPGKDVLSTQNGDQYLTPFIEDAFLYSGLGYDGVSGTGDDVQIVSNSFGFSGTDNDGFDFESRLIDSIIRDLAPHTATLWSTGNGAAGYGTAAPPSPAAGIGIGASTLYGTIGLFEQIASADQILAGDPMSWSNRGPGVRNTAGADVVASGAFGTGDLSLNLVLWGAIATDNFGGTSMAAPVAAGNLALMYQAWYDRTGSWPTFEQANDMLLGSATDTHNDIWTQGAGLVNADVGTDAAGGDNPALYASPSQWSVGDYRGTEYPAFTHVASPGERDTQVFTLHNASASNVTASVDAYTFELMGTNDYSFTSLDQSLDHGSFTTPDYVFRIDEHIPPGTDLLQVRVTKPYEQFNPTGTLAGPFGQYNNWRVHLQNWTDVDGDGEFWIDVDGDGKVAASGEMETGEHIRFTYGYNAGPAQQARIHDPLGRIDDGLLLTLRHRNQDPSVPNTDLTIEVSYWQKTDWRWASTRPSVSVPAGGTASLTARIDVPAHAPAGMYQGALEVSYDGREVVIPVTVAVAKDRTDFKFGATNLQKGRDALYDNTTVSGYTDYGWRAESGDWRFFYTDVTSVPAVGNPFLVVETDWASDLGDIDTIILGPELDGFSAADPSVYGPYTLSEVGRSAYTYVGSGRWAYQTSSGSSRELVSAPLQEGLHGILLHHVYVDGDALDEAFRGRTGVVTIDSDVVAGGAADSASIGVDSELDLTDFVAEGFGLGAPVVSTETASQDDPNDPSSASVKVPVTIDHAAFLRVNTEMPTDDLDLFVVYDANGDGAFTNDEIIGSSTTPASDEFVDVSFPADGDYEVWVQGWSVAGNPQFTLTIDAAQGYDIVVDSLPTEILAGGSGTIEVSWDITGAPSGTYSGVVLFGPADAPGLFEMPVVVNVP